MKVGQQLVRQSLLNSSNEFRCCVGKLNFWHIVPFAWSGGRKLVGGWVGMRRLKLLEVGGSSAAQSLCKTAAAAVEWRRARQGRAPQAPVKFFTPGAAVRVAKVRRR